jgi:hypothetical protein
LKKWLADLGGVAGNVEQSNTHATRASAHFNDRHDAFAILGIEVDPALEISMTPFYIERALFLCGNEQRSSQNRCIPALWAAA